MNEITEGRKSLIRIRHFFFLFFFNELNLVKHYIISRFPNLCSYGEF